MLITEMLARNARMYPNDPALIELRPDTKVRKEITWREFDERVNKVANALMDRGVRKGDKVILWMMNSINWLEVYFGIIRTGAWAVPLNFRFTSQDLKYCADIAEAKTMILEEEFTERVEAIRSQLSMIKDYIFVGQNPAKDMEGLEDIIGKSSAKPVKVEINDEDGCGLYFTSGTTGAPKPILITHKNMGSAAIYENYRQCIKHEDNFLVMPPFYHLGAKIHWLGCLIVGARTTILPEVSPRNIFEAIHNERTTVVFLLVPWAQDILGALDRGELKKEDYDLSYWRLMYIGAQPVPPSLVKHWKAYFPVMQYQTVYGLSESTGPGCVYLRAEDERKVGAIGKAGFNWETRIVNDKGEDAVPGEVGELLVRGDGVMKEYYKNPEKTAETLRDGWLYTGDVARQDDEGFIYIVDRKKDVVITGGENIYPVEIEEVLQSHPKVYDVGVIGIPDERLGEIALAVIAPKPGETLTEEEVNQFCEQNLPRYKRPRRIIFDKVPRNPTGKIEKPKMREKYTGIKESFRI
jgi:acyl-CoA synthetase (AMP-forming)/AMP-acid ligase II